MVFNWWFARHVRSRVRSTFAEMRVAGLAQVCATAATHPILIVSNHTSWWDPLLVVYFSNLAFDTDGYGMMDAKNLVNFPFFRAVGAFGVDLDDARDGARSIRYSTDLLSKPKRMLWVFAQGKEVPITSRPLHFHKGASAISHSAAQKHHAVTFPVALRYEFGSEEKPTIYVSFGPPVPSGLNRAERHTHLASAVEHELARIEHAIHSKRLDDFAIQERKPEPFSAHIAVSALRMLFSSK